MGKGRGSDRTAKGQSVFRRDAASVQRFLPKIFFCSCVYTLDTTHIYIHTTSCHKRHRTRKLSANKRAKVHRAHLADTTAGASAVWQPGGLRSSKTKEGAQQ
eukprot:scaffold14682_cov124-Isochrysis_galbana.AAC.10